MEDIVSLEGPVELLDGELVVRIPLTVGGDKLAALARGVGRVCGEYLVVELPQSLAEKLQIGEGSLVVVDNHHGKFTITRSAQNDAAQPPSGVH